MFIRVEYACAAQMGIYFSNKIFFLLYSIIFHRVTFPEKYGILGNINFYIVHKNNGVFALNREILFQYLLNTDLESGDSTKPTLSFLRKITKSSVSANCKCVHKTFQENLVRPKQ